MIPHHLLILNIVSLFVFVGLLLFPYSLPCLLPSMSNHFAVDRRLLGVFRQGPINKTIYLLYSTYWEYQPSSVLPASPAIEVTRGCSVALSLLLSCLFTLSLFWLVLSPFFPLVKCVQIKTEMRRKKGAPSALYTVQEYETRLTKLQTTTTTTTSTTTPTPTIVLVLCTACSWGWFNKVSLPLPSSSPSSRGTRTRTSLSAGLFGTWTQQVQSHKLFLLLLYSLKESSALSPLFVPIRLTGLGSRGRRRRRSTCCGVVVCASSLSQRIMKLLCVLTERRTNGRAGGKEARRHGPLTCSRRSMHRN